MNPKQSSPQDVSDKETKTVTILSASKTHLIATNATERPVWKKQGENSYVFSHVERLKPTHTLTDLVATDEDTADE